MATIIYYNTRSTETVKTTIARVFITSFICLVTKNLRGKKEHAGVQMYTHETL